MSATLVKIIEEARALPPDELRQLLEELEKIEVQMRGFHVQQVKGKYAHVATSSDEFAAAKAEEIALEDRRRAS